MPWGNTMHEILIILKFKIMVYETRKKSRKKLPGLLRAFE